MNVYWACMDKSWLRAEKPENVLKLYFQSDRYEANNSDLNLQYCPGFKDSLKNVYAVRSIFDYSFSVEDNNISSPMHDQQFFQDHVLVRSMDKRVFSFMTNYLFFTDEKSLEMTAYEYPFFEENNITKSCIPIQGKFDIGKWFRPTEYSFYLKENVNEFKVENKEIMFYLRFHTNEKINFKQFRVNDKIRSFVNENVNSAFYLNNRVSKEGGIESFYKLMKTKKMILKEIKDNLL